MAQLKSARDGAAHTGTQTREVLRADEMKIRVQELVEYRDAGVLSDAELEDHKSKLHWGTG